MSAARFDKSGLDERLIACGLDPEDVYVDIQDYLDEDLSHARRDLTSESIFDPNHSSIVAVTARSDGLLAGLPVAHAVFHAMPGPTEFTYLAKEGARIRAGQVLARVSGRTRDLLAAERTALNLLCRMCGVATHTRRFADVLADWPTTVLDTRKTTPGMRALEKYAVRTGGGGNKRMGLYDVAMIKDNHKEAAGSITEAFRAVRSAEPEIDIQVEVETLDEAVEAVAVGATFLLCDNMSPKELGEVVDAVGDRAELEATGRITLDTAVEYAASGVDFISVGALTHSSPILDIGLDFEE
ncbi:carboxylating nicotinate-nucleotide diphosphorylase [Glycomyces buryatensis]|uniref:Nicotinate-nucleotide pyrophosphorylase [carboxylating] n=1 Tax=Glycomyces buryatensis TaxID=2570927 RepID=A0A4S8QC97_9ACTN|nr:carboxylating nicotinate-nucleotide diphosphorylase [Glycomyces buryatensis]THV41910.1 carboxylating nicotinate-nucleotide diphosphorylase [Glycomyces buryatensis]